MATSQEIPVWFYTRDNTVAAADLAVAGFPEIPVAASHFLSPSWEPLSRRPVFLLDVSCRAVTSGHDEMLHVRIRRGWFVRASPFVSRW